MGRAAGAEAVAVGYNVENTGKCDLSRIRAFPEDKRMCGFSATLRGTLLLYPLKSKYGDPKLGFYCYVVVYERIAGE
jgi:hypothetical protein